YVKRYKYDGNGKVIQFDNMTIESGSINNKRAEFSYNAKGQVTEQVISLATINYNYFPDGRLKTKAYHYNKAGGTGNDPWTIYFIYDENKRLMHADSDSNSTVQTSFYNVAG